MSALLSLVNATFVPGLDAITATWGNIVFTHPTVTGTNADVTITYTSGGTRTLQLSFSMFGTLSYRINAGSYVTISPGGTFTVSSGDTVGFKFDAVSGSYEFRFITVTDATRESTISTFVAAYEDSGGGGFDPPPPGGEEGGGGNDGGHPV